MPYNPHKVGPVDLGVEFLPWLQRVDQVIASKPDTTSQRSYAKRILEILDLPPLLSSDFLVNSDTVLGRRPDRPENRRFLFTEGFLFMGSLQNFGYLRPVDAEDHEARGAKGLTLIFDRADALGFYESVPFEENLPPSDTEDKIEISSLEVPVGKVVSLVRASL